MSRHQRNTWGINFQKPSSSSVNANSNASVNADTPKQSYNANPPPPCLMTHTRSHYDNPLGSASQGVGGGSRIVSSLGKRRIKDEDEYFNEEEDGGPGSDARHYNDLEYIPAPNSPSAVRLDHCDADSNASEDPLDAYMNEIDNELKRLKQPKSSAAAASASKNRALRIDLEGEDELESYIKFMEQNPHVGGGGGGGNGDEDEVVYEYDEDGNIINKEKKAIEPLPPTDHSLINYLPFEKNFYTAHPEIEAMVQGDVIGLLKKLGIHVSGILPPKPVCSFAHFGFDEKLISVIRKSGFITPTPIQSQAVPIALSGRDIIGIAKTGSGKTAAFLWPLLIHIMDQPELQLGDGPIGLICAPTRELAQQIYQEAKKFGKVYNIQVVCGYGGGNMYEQQRACEAGCEILVCTPGRLIDLIKKKAVNLRRVTYLVFDEADKMFNLGFEPQVRSIAKNVRPDRQTLLFSATFKWKVEKLARDVLTDPIKVVQGTAGEANEDVSQIVQVLNKEDEKFPWLITHIVRLTTLGSVLIFTTRKITSIELSDKLKEFNFHSLLIHGDVHQSDRNAAIQAFRKGDSRIMVATDVAARGLDIASIRTVINYDVARDIDTHTHRIGRTGRAGTKGTAYTLVTRDKDKDFAGHLVRNLEGAGQPVPQDLIDLANQSTWFRKSRCHVSRRNGKKMSDNLGVRSRPGLGCTVEHLSPGSGVGTGNHVTDDFDASSDNLGGVGLGPQTDRISTMKAAFNAQYQRMFVSAGVEGSKFTHPQRVGETVSQDHSSSTSSSTRQPGEGRRKKSRWD